MTDTADHLTDDDLEALATEVEDDTELVRKLRRQLRQKAQKAKRADELEQENRTLRFGSLVSQADLSELNEDQRETLAEWASKQEQVDADVLRARAERLGWAEPKPDPAEEALDEQEAISQAASGARAKGDHVITPQDAAQWDTQKIREFRSQHPDAFKRLQRGEPVSGIAF